MTEHTKPEIIAEQKFGEFHVHVKGQPGKWAQGKTIMHAVGTLVCDHPDTFGVTINYDHIESVIPARP